MVLRDKIIFWLLAIVAFFWFLGHISSVLAPFISAIIIAYFLDPLADKLEQKGLNRSIAVFVILSIFITVIVLICLLLIPMFYREFVALLNAVPKYYKIFLNDTYPTIILFLEQNGYQVDQDYRKYISEDNLAKIFNFSNGVIGGVVHSSVSVINLLSLIFITPIVVFYLLKDWNHFVGNVNQLLPKKYASKLRKIFIKIDITLSGYIRGQFNVCLILGVIYAVGLLLVGLNFGFLIGFFTGLMSFVPYVGMLIGVGVAVIISLFQWGIDFGQIGLVAMIFLIGQVLESNFLTPKLVGNKIGLHPVWVMFAIFAFGVLFGFIGVFLAVPMAAVLGVIIKFIASEYKRVYVK